MGREKKKKSSEDGINFSTDDVSVLVVLTTENHVQDLTVAFACSIPKLKCAVLVVVSNG